ncbi:MAG: rhodanese-like domain-containing protein [Verrucomicrobiaceae bacterium]|nr:MAG: rhodanese-like domain-containing protein [Verrucomicrobiaceae bacterium]
MLRKISFRSPNVVNGMRRSYPVRAWGGTVFNSEKSGRMMLISGWPAAVPRLHCAKFPTAMRTFLHTLLLVSIITVSPAFAEEKPAPAPVKTEQATKDIAAGIQIVDARTPDEWSEGYIKGAKLVTYPDDFAAKAAKAVDPEKPVLVYCRSGGRSAKAAQLLRDAGFKDVRDLAGGIIAWEKDGKPVVKPAAEEKAGK